MIPLFEQSTVSFGLVLRAYCGDHGTKQDSWETRNLRRADRKFGNWVHGMLPVECIGSIVMPHHVGACTRSSDLPQKILLVPPMGLTLGDAHERFQLMRERYQQLAPDCYRKIMDFKDRVTHDAGSFFLSEEPHLIGSSYEGLTAFKGQLTHLDGVHRLMAIMDTHDKPPFIECYVAVSRDDPSPSGQVPIHDPA